MSHHVDANSKWLGSSESLRLLVVADVAAWLNVSTSLVYQLVDRGVLPVYRIGNGRGSIRFKPDEISEYLESCRIQNHQVQPKRKVRPRLKHLRMH